MSKSRLPAALLALVLACREGPPRVVASVPDAGSRALLDRAAGKREEGDEEGALAIYREAIARSPYLVEAHRAVQEIRLARLEKGALLEEYGRLLEGATERPEPHYLLGRILADPSERRAAFERALARDPAFAFGHHGIAAVRRAEGDAKGAEAAYRRAIACDPRLPDPRRGLVELLLGTDRFREALREAEEGLRVRPGDGRLAALASAAERRLGLPRALPRAIDAVREAPGEVGPLRALREALEERPTEESLSRARLGLAEGEGREKPREVEAERRATLGWIEMARGDPFAAAAEYREASALGYFAPSLREEFGLALLAAGSFQEARKVWLAGSATGIDGGPLSRALEACAEAPGDGQALGALARALRAGGRTRAARLVAGRLRALVPGDREGAEIAAACDREEAFVRGVREILKGTDRDRKGTRGLGAFLAEASTLSRRLLGEDAARGSRIRSYLPVGWILDPSPGAGGLPGWFAERGRFALFGRRLLGRPDGIVLRILARGPCDGEILGRPFRGEVVLGEAREISPARIGAGGEIAGAAAFEGYFVDLDAVRYRAAEVERILERHAPRRQAVYGDPLPPCRTEDALLSIAEPLALEEKLLLRAGERRERGWVDRVLETVELHERAHLADAAALLPIGSHLLPALRLLLRGGASARGVEALLEGRAELCALAASEETDLALAGMASAAAAEGSRSPHAVGYRRILEALVRRVRERRRRGEEWPAFRDDRNVYQQLFLVPAEVLREEARAVAAEEGLVPPPSAWGAGGG
ncbi:MAG TPA: tetratricopeptide repeat protein [Planctomycetota bacterium]|nr:tetratricopeptide repeat protein [Planctomycetota bacterium]